MRAVRVGARLGFDNRTSNRRRAVLANGRWRRRRRTGQILDSLDANGATLPSATTCVLSASEGQRKDQHIVCARVHPTHPSHSTLWTHPFPFVISITPPVSVRAHIEIV